MDAILELLSNEQLIGGLTGLLGGGAGVGLSIARKLGLKPASLIGSLFKRKKNPLKELMDVIKAFRDGKPKDEIIEEIWDVLEAIKPLLKNKK